MDMIAILSGMTPDILTTIAVLLGLLLAAVVAAVLLFGRERIWSGVVALWRRLVGGSTPPGPLVAVLLALPLLGGCAELDAFLDRAEARRVAICERPDGTRTERLLDLAVDETGATAPQSELMTDIDAWCAKLGGALAPIPAPAAE